jgi:hypothetical protein
MPFALLRSRNLCIKTIEIELLIVVESLVAVVGGP